MQAELVRCSKTNEYKDLFSFIRVRKKPEHEKEKNEPITQEAINSYAYNGQLYNHVLINSDHTTVLKGLYNSSNVPQPGIQNILLVKNLLKSILEKHNSLPMKPVQIRRMDFSYRLRSVNFIVPAPKHSKTLDIIIGEYSVIKRINGFKKIVKKHLKGLDRDKNPLSVSFIFVELVVYLLIEAAQKKDMQLENFDRIVNTLSYRYKNYYRKNIRDLKPDLSSFIEECIVYIDGAIMELESHIAEVDEIIESETEIEQQKQHRVISNEKEKEIRIVNTFIVSDLKVSLDLYEKGYYVVLFKNAFLVRYIKPVLNYIVDAAPEASLKKEEILEEIIKEVHHMATKYLHPLKKYPLEAFYSATKKISIVFNIFQATLLDCIIKELKWYEKRGEITCIYSLFDDVLMKLIRIFLFSEIAKEMPPISEYFDDSVAYAKEALKEMSFDVNIASLKKISNGFFSELACNIEKTITVKEHGEFEVKKKELTKDVFTSIYSEYNDYLRKLYYTVKKEKKKEKIWNNPAFLHYNVSEDLDPEKATLYVIYRCRKSKNLYKKEVKNITRNLKIFSEIRIAEDIEFMEGGEKQKISMDDLLKLEEKELDKPIKKTEDCSKI